MVRSGEILGDRSETHPQVEELVVFAEVGSG